MSTFNYKTGQGETWGSIAWKMYGSMSGIKTLIEANTAVPIDPELPEGTVLLIPILDDTDSAILTTKLPPWK